MESRPADDDHTVRRRRECASCLRRFTTYERVEVEPLVVVKKDGRREAFDRSKTMRGLIKSCEKRPVSMEAIEGLVLDVERALRERGEREVPSTVIGEMVMERLRRLDEVAYVRFASVYRQFADVHHFQNELDRLLREPARGQGTPPAPGDATRPTSTNPGGTPRGDIG